jgi:hypothetical protein
VESGRIEVLASYPRIASTYALVRVNIEIDGSLATCPWGRHAYEVAPGTHSVAVWYQGGRLSTGRRKDVRVEVEAGKTTRVTYRAPIYAFFRAKLTSEDAVPV